MSFEDVVEFESEFSQGILRVRTLELENGKLILLSDSDRYRLGPSAVAIPPSHGRVEPTSTGLFTMGLDSTIVRTLSERLSVMTNQTCMVIVGVRDLTQAVMLEVMTILKNHLVA